jgi:hypothetical protein
MNLHEPLTLEIIFYTLGILSLISIVSVVLILRKAKNINDK